MPLNFIDIASHQAGINLGAIPDLGGVIIKATEGTGYVNPLCDQHYQEAKRLGLALGIYHFAGSSGDKRLGDPEAEWVHFRDQCAGYRGEAIPVLDYEPFGYSNPSIGWAEAWAAACYRDWGVWPVLYLARYHVNAGGDAWRWLAERCGLWLAQDTGYYNTRMTAFDPPSTPGVADFWTIFGFQYCANGHLGGVAPVDMDIAHVDRAGWNAYATGSTTTITYQEEDDMPYTPAEIHDFVWHGADGATLIENPRIGRGEWADTLLGHMEDRITRQILEPKLAAMDAKLNVILEIQNKIIGGGLIDSTKIDQAIQTGIEKKLDDLEITLGVKKTEEVSA